MCNYQFVGGGATNQHYRNDQTESLENRGGNEALAQNCRYEKIRNHACAGLVLCGKHCEVQSNSLSAEVIKLKVVSEQSCRYVLEGNEIKYKVTLYNCSGCDLHDVEFIDTYSNGAKYRCKSFSYNGVHKDPVIKGHTLCYLINEIKSGEKAVICFDLIAD